MNILEAIKAVKQGYRVTRKGFCDNEMYLIRDGKYNPYVECSYYNLNIEDIEADNWEIEEKLYSFVEAVKAMLDGEEIKRLEKEDYIFKYADVIFFDKNDIMAMDWVIKSTRLNKIKE